MNNSWDHAAGHWRGRAGAVVSENVAMSTANYERTDKGDPITPEAHQWQAGPETTRRHEMNKEIKQQVKALEKLRLPELQARFVEIVGEETKAPNRKFLVRRITEALEAQAGDAPPAEAATKPAKKKRYFRKYPVKGSAYYAWVPSKGLFHHFKEAGGDLKFKADYTLTELLGGAEGTVVELASPGAKVGSIRKGSTKHHYIARHSGLGK